MKHQAASPEMTAEKQVYVLGPKNLQNELLCYFMSKELGAETRIVDDVAALTPAGEAAQKKHLLLIDTVGLAPKRIVEELKSKPLAACVIVAFFNLKHGLGIEREAIKQGLRGLFYETEGMAHFLKGVKVLFDGQIWVSRETLVEAVVNGQGRKGFPEQDNAGLSARELEVLALISAGANNKQVADKLFVSENTVKTHIYNIYKKIKVPNRLQAALWMAHRL